jgi:hypothetical protein
LAAELVRLRRLAKAYRPYGRAYRFEIEDDAIVAERVEVGNHKKLGKWYELRPGQTCLLIKDAGVPELNAARRTAKYLRDRGRGVFSVELDETDLKITRVE